MTENRCDELFGKNGELVEFRKKQVLEGAFGIIRRSYKDKPNKMEMIAKLFGKELGEEFCVRSHHPEGNCIGAFTKYGFECPNYTDKENQVVFTMLVTGKAVIVDARD